MKTLHVEFDLLVTDRDYEDLMKASEISLQDNIMDALEVYDECENIMNFRIELKENED